MHDEMMSSDMAAEVGDSDLVDIREGDSRGVVSYLVVRESDQYVAIMDVLESSVTDLTPREIVAALQAAGTLLDERVVEERLKKLRKWGAVSPRTDTSRILRHSDLLARHWRYTATPTGRQAQRFYRTVLAGTPAVREIPCPVWPAWSTRSTLSPPACRRGASTRPNSWDGSLSATTISTRPWSAPRMA